MTLLGARDVEENTGSEESGSEESGSGSEDSGKSSKASGSESESKTVTGTSTSASYTTDETGEITDAVVAGVCIRQRPNPMHPDLRDLCSSLYAAWDCLNHYGFLLDENINETVRMSLYAVVQVASEKCKGKWMTTDNYSYFILFVLYF